MDTLTPWLGFLGSWLVVTGSVYQASLELRAERDETDRIRAIMIDLPTPPPVARRWWLVPPWRLVLERRRRTQIRQRVIDAMDAEDFDLLTRYVNKATGWIYVGVGGSCIAIVETWGLADRHHWPVAAFVVLSAAMVVAAVGHAAARNRRTEQATSEHRARVHGDGPA